MSDSVLDFDEDLIEFGGGFGDSDMVNINIFWSLSLLQWQQNPSGKLKIQYLINIPP